jgi:HD superfamily phosphohydrolase YqeK
LARTSPTADAIGLPAWAVVTEKRVRHIERVATLLADWADAMEVSGRERGRWLRAAWLHDALKDAPLTVLRRHVDPSDGPAAIWHGPAAARRAEQEGEHDQGVLDAVRYHSIGYAGWDRVGRMLYLADFLESGRHLRHPDRGAHAAEVPRDPDAVLREVARRRIAHGLKKGWPLLPETVAFWNALT